MGDGWTQMVQSGALGETAQAGSQAPTDTSSGNEDWRASSSAGSLPPVVPTIPLPGGVTEEDLNTGPVPEVRETANGYTVKNPDGTYGIPGIGNNLTPKDISNKLGSAYAEPSTREKLTSFLNSGTAATVAGGIGALAAGPFGTLAGLIPKLAGSIAGWGDMTTDQKMEQIKAKLDGMSPDEQAKALAELKQPKIDTAAPSSSSTPIDPNSAQGQVGRTDSVNTHPEATPEQAKSNAINEAANKILADKAAQQEAERARISGLVQGYNPQANQARYSPIDISNAANPNIAASMQRYNDLLASTAEQEAISARAQERLAGAPDVTDAWRQYYAPGTYRSDAAQSQVAQAQFTPGAPAVTMQGTYQGDVSRLAGYDPTIQRSDQRQSALEAMDLTRQRALGLAPSVAANQYRQDLDALARQQASAVAGLRGPNTTGAQEALARQTAMMGQQAVRETAGLRMQEQQAAEQLYSQQANALMIEDQKLATSEKVNQLSQLTALTQANLENAKNTLEKDRFNADAINTVNRLDTQLRNQMAELNAQLANQTAINNASEANKISLANAVNALEASRWAGNAAQSVNQAQAALKRGDILADYGYGQDVVQNRQAGLSTIANALGQMGTAQEGWNINQQRWDQVRADQAAQNKAAEDLRTVQAYGGLAKSAMDLISEWSSSGSRDSYADWLRKNYPAEYNKTA